MIFVAIYRKSVGPDMPANERVYDVDSQLWEWIKLEAAGVPVEYR